jgi:hypothetical protein
MDAGVRVNLALASTTSKELLIFCSPKCRSTYREVAKFAQFWTDTETTHTRPLNCFGNPTWRSACSTCGRSFDGTADEPVSQMTLARVKS